eukprot:2688728-Amphidinium_carterae.1
MAHTKACDGVWRLYQSFAKNDLQPMEKDQAFDSFGGVLVESQYGKRRSVGYTAQQWASVDAFVAADADSEPVAEATTDPSVGLWLVEGQESFGLKAFEIAVVKDSSKNLRLRCLSAMGLKVYEGIPTEGPPDKTDLHNDVRMSFTAFLRWLFSGS